MAYENFIPTVWNESIDRELDRLCVFAEDCNRQYEGDAKEKGESVKILGVGKPTIRSIAKSARNNDIEGPEEIEDTSVIMQINQIRYFNYMVGDIDKAQMSPSGIMDALATETSEELASSMDSYIASKVADSNVKKLNPTPTKVTEENVLDILDDALQLLYENDVKPSTEIVVTVTPRFYKLFKRAYAVKDTNNSGILKNGKVGMYGNATVKMSNNVFKSKTSVDNDTDNIMIRTKRAVAFVKALTHTEPYRPEKKFADAVKGFVLFDAKVVRPKEMINVNVTY